MLFHFLGSLGKTPDLMADTEVFSYAHGFGFSGKNLPTSLGVLFCCLAQVRQLAQTAANSLPQHLCIST